MRLKSFGAIGLVTLMLVGLLTLPLLNSAVGQAKKKKNQARQQRPPLVIPEVGKDEVICFALYTVHDNILKLTAQLYPLDESDAKVCRLEIKQDGKWTEIARAKIIERGWTAPFRVEKWDATKNIEYRVAHGTTAFYTGLVRKDPVDKN